MRRSDRTSIRRESNSRLFDLATAALLLLLFAPVFVVVAAAILVDSRGPVLIRCRRVGRHGQLFEMLKFRKMFDGASGSALTVAADARLTRVGRILLRFKLDELPQLWNVLRGEMSLVGPRPEDPQFVSCYPDDFVPILRVRPGITGLAQLAYAREAEIVNSEDPEPDYLMRILPQKIALDTLYAATQSTVFDLSILYWTAVAVVLRRDIAVDRRTGKLRIRRRPAPEPALGVSAAAARGQEG